MKTIIIATIDINKTLLKNIGSILHLKNKNIMLPIILSRKATITTAEVFHKKNIINKSPQYKIK